MTTKIIVVVDNFSVGIIRGHKFVFEVLFEIKIF